MSNVKCRNFVSSIVFLDPVKLAVTAIMRRGVARVCLSVRVQKNVNNFGAHGRNVQQWATEHSTSEWGNMTKDNGYRVGSLAWVERENYRTMRHMLNRLLMADAEDRATGTDKLCSEVYCVRDEIHSFDTDSASS